MRRRARGRRWRERTTTILLCLTILVSVVHRLSDVYSSRHLPNISIAFFLIDGTKLPPSSSLFEDDSVRNNCNSTDESIPIHHSSGSRPILTLHVGPPKTGSTTLQCTLESLREELQRDNIVYVGRPECQGMTIGYKHKQEFRLFENALVTGYECQRELNAVEERMKANDIYGLPSCWDDFIEKLERYHREGKNFVFSDEALATRLARTKKYRPALPYPWKALKTTLETRMGWEVRILMVHRPLFEYLPSVYIEQYKDGPLKRRLRQWFGGGLCPSQGGRAVPRPFDTQTDEITIARLLEPQQTLYCTPAQVYELAQANGFQTILVDMMEKVPSKHGDGQELDFVQHIICDQLPGTTHTCKALLSQDQEEKQRNPSLSLNYDFLAIEACQKGWINGTKVSRDVARRAMQQRQEQQLKLSANDFPLLCPDDETYEKLLQASLDHERRIRKGRRGCNYTEEEESRHNNSFWNKAVAKKKFCTVDSKKVLAEDGWRKFLASLSSLH